jgi:hypothetical protein
MAEYLIIFSVPGRLRTSKELFLAFTYFTAGFAFNKERT